MKQAGYPMGIVRFNRVLTGNEWFFGHVKGEGARGIRALNRN
jgi:hypothetical protein